MHIQGHDPMLSRNEIHNFIGDSENGLTDV